jgi:hypothetical protein
VVSSSISYIKGAKPRKAVKEQLVCCLLASVPCGSFSEYICVPILAKCSSKHAHRTKNSKVQGIMAIGHSDDSHAEAMTIECSFLVPAKGENPAAAQPNGLCNRVSLIESYAWTS